MPSATNGIRNSTYTTSVVKRAVFFLLYFGKLALTIVVSLGYTSNLGTVFQLQ